MQRVVIVGPPCSGKTTLAHQLGEHLHLPHTELDGLWWESGWTEAGASSFRSKLLPVVSEDRWVLDGNYWHVGATDSIYPRADTIIWLEFPRRVTVPRAIRRTMRRAITRTELWSGNREPLSQSLRMIKLIRRAMTGFPEYNASIATVLASPDLAHLTVVRLRKPAEVRSWLKSLDPVPTNR